jgi:hypothetical protein
MNRDEFPAMEQFLGGYFHQDYLLDYATPADAVAAFLNEAPREIVRATYDEMEKLLPVPRQMDNPCAFLLEIGRYYDPRLVGLAVVNWFKELRKKLRSRLE